MPLASQAELRAPAEGLSPTGQPSVHTLCGSSHAKTGPECSSHAYLRLVRAYLHVSFPAAWRSVTCERRLKSYPTASEPCAALSSQIDAHRPRTSSPARRPPGGGRARPYLRVTGRGSTVAGPTIGSHWHGMPAWWHSASPAIRTRRNEHIPTTHASKVTAAHPYLNNIAIIVPRICRRI